MDPKTQLIFVISSGGIPMGVPPKGGGGPGCFPLVRIVSRRFGPRCGRCRCAEMCPMGHKTLSNRVHTFNHHETPQRPSSSGSEYDCSPFVLVSPTVAPASTNERLWLQLGTSFGRFVVVQSATGLWTCRSLVLQPAIQFRQFSGHSITIGSTVTEGRQSARPALPFLLWGVWPMALFGSSQCLGG